MKGIPILHSIFVTRLLEREISECVDGVAETSRGTEGRLGLVSWALRSLSFRVPRHDLLYSTVYSTWLDPANVLTTSCRVRSWAIRVHDVY